MEGGGGRGVVAMGTHPMAAARANGSHAATEAMFGAITTTSNQLIFPPSVELKIRHLPMFLPFKVFDRAFL